MPFKKIGSNTYVSPAGNKFTRSQVKKYYAEGGRFPGQKGMGEQLPKSPTTPDFSTKADFNIPKPWGNKRY
jgi:hypothetical protein